MGLKLERMSGSRFFFLMRGCTTACLRVAGMEPEMRDVLIIVRTVGPMEVKTSLKSREGMQSVGQFVGRRWVTMSEREGREIGRN